MGVGFCHISKVHDGVGKLTESRCMTGNTETIDFRQLLGRNMRNQVTVVDDSKRDVPEDFRIVAPMVILIA